MFSTPVSSLKAPRNSILKLKSTRFQLPSSEEKSRKNYDSTESTQRYVHVNSMLVYFIQNNSIDRSFRSTGTGNVADKLSTCRRWHTEDETNTIPYPEICETRCGCIERTYSWHTGLSQSRIAVIVSGVNFRPLPKNQFSIHVFPLYLQSSARASCRLVVVGCVPVRIYDRNSAIQWRNTTKSIWKYIESQWV